MQSERETGTQKKQTEIAGCLNEWMNDWMKEWVSDWCAEIEMKCSGSCLTRTFSTFPAYDGQKGFAQITRKCHCLSLSHLRQSAPLSISLYPSLALLCEVHPLTHCCVILLLYYSKLTVEWVKWPVQQGCCCHCCLFCSLSVSLSACLSLCLSAGLSACLSAPLSVHLRKEIRCFSIHIVTLFTQLAFVLKIHFSCKLFRFSLYTFHM